MDKIETISELVENQMLFESKGFSIVKVTRNGVEGPLRLPIKSTGVAEYQDKLSQKAPRPPVTNRFTKRNSEEGKALGLSHDTIVRVIDTADESYLDALEAHTRDFTWRIAVFALDISWKKADGTMAESYEEKLAILKTNGLTGHHLDQIYLDIENLTRWSEDREDFLSGD